VEDYLEKRRKDRKRWSSLIFLIGQREESGAVLERKPAANLMGQDGSGRRVVSRK
jgi:hypothetical protein